MKEFDGSVQLSATDVADLSACGHLVTLEVDAMRGRRVRPNTYSAVTTRLIKLGDDHERAYLDNLKTQGKTVEELNSKISQEDGAARTLACLVTEPNSVSPPGATWPTSVAWRRT